MVYTVLQEILQSASLKTMWSRGAHATFLQLAECAGRQAKGGGAAPQYGIIRGLLSHAMEIQTEIEAMRKDLCELRKLLRQQEKLHQSEMQILRREVEQLKKAIQTQSTLKQEREQQPRPPSQSLLSSVRTPTCTNYFCGSLPPFYFTLHNFTHHRKHGLRWYSSPFYSHPFGYKMSIGLDADGNNGGRGTHVSLLVYLLRGEFDDYIKWPFRGSVILQLLNERRDGGHYETVVEFTDETPLVNSGRVVKDERGAGWGPVMIPHSHLTYDPTTDSDYVKFDRLCFVVTKIVPR